MCFLAGSSPHNARQKSFMKQLLKFIKPNVRQILLLMLPYSLAAERFAKTAMVCCFNSIVHISQKAKRIAKVATLRRGVSLVAGTASHKKFCVFVRMVDFFPFFCYTFQIKQFCGDNMLIKIGNHEFTEVWDGVFYKKLSHYPQITDWEIRTIIEFVQYEKLHGRECTIECEDDDVLNAVSQGLLHKEKYLRTPRPKLITECTACPYRKGCVTDYVCHTTSPQNAVEIFQC